MHRALAVAKKVPFEIIVIDRNGPEVFIAATVQVYFFTDLTRSCRLLLVGSQFWKKWLSV